MTQPDPQHVMNDILQQVILDSRKVVQRFEFTGWMLAHAKADILHTHIGQMIAEISTLVRTHHLPPEQFTRNAELYVPATWWQHWKRDVAGKRRWLSWIVRRWPVRHTLTKATMTVDLSRYRTYPDAPDIGHISGYAMNYLQHDLSSRIDYEPPREL
jgi:hypothetical protein